MTVAQALSASLDALFRTRKLKPTDFAVATGLSSATVSKLRSGTRWPSLSTMEQLREFFGVEPYVLLHPVAAMSGSDRNPDTNTLAKAHTALVDPAGDPLPSAHPSAATGGAEPVNSPLFQKLTALWQALEPDQKRSLVKTAANMVADDEGGFHLPGRVRVSK